jgi:hypothetical protein
LDSTASQKNPGPSCALRSLTSAEGRTTFSGTMATQYTLIGFAVELPQVNLKAPSDNLQSLPCAALKSFQRLLFRRSKMAHNQEASGFSQVSTAGASQSCKVSRRLVFELTAQRRRVSNNREMRHPSLSRKFA